MRNYIKKAFCTILLTAVFAGLTSMAQSSPNKADSLRYEILMSSKMLDSIHFNEKFIKYVDITSHRLVLLSSSDQFYLLGWGGIVPLGKKIAGKIYSYAITPDGLLMAVNNDRLCAFDTLGNLSTIYKLPREEMGISSGKNGMFIYDQNNDHQINMLYVLAKGGKFAQLFGISTPIHSVVEMTDSILFASDNAVYSYRFADKKMKILVALAENSLIRSIAVDTLGSRIYFSTENMVFTMKDSKALLVTDKFGGEIKYFNDGLLVFNPGKRILLRIVGLEGLLVH
jgi:hypothetical protein